MEAELYHNELKKLSTVHGISNLTTEKQEKDKYNIEERLYMKFILEWNMGILGSKRNIKIIKGLLPNQKLLLKDLITTGYTEEEVIRATREYFRLAKSDTLWGFKYFPHYNLTTFIEKGIAKFSNTEEVKKLEKELNQEVEDEIVPYGYRTLD